MRLRKIEIAHPLFLLTFIILGYGAAIWSYNLSPKGAMSISSKISDVDITYKQSRRGMRCDSPSSENKVECIKFIEFMLQGSEIKFLFPTVFSDLALAASYIRIGNNAEVIYTGTGPLSFEIWGLTVNGVVLISPETAKEEREINVYYCLGVGIISTLIFIAQILSKRVQSQT
jgi:hypothetical protein